MNNSPYNAKFYNRSGRYDSAAVVLDLLFRVHRPRSIIDIGSGQGAWLAAAEELGVKTLEGWDGDWVDTGSLLSKEMRFRAVDLCEAGLEISPRYDLCMSLEVGEHLPGSASDQFVRLLCSGSDLVLFSAAVPNQGGTEHQNERPQSYWIGKFKAQGYDCFDFLRPALWENDAVETWYKQNVFLFVNKSAPRFDRAAMKAMEAPIYDVIHPSMLNYQASVARSRWNQMMEPDLRFCLGCLKRWLSKPFRQRKPKETAKIT